MFMLLALPAQTPQQRADAMLLEWQKQRKEGIPPDQRTLSDDKFNRDLNVIREALERTR